MSYSVFKRELFTWKSMQKCVSKFHPVSYRIYLPESLQRDFIAKSTDRFTSSNGTLETLLSSSLVSGGNIYFTVFETATTAVGAL